MKKIILATLLATSLCTLVGCNKKETPKAGDEIGSKNHVEFVLNDDLETLTARIACNGYYSDEGGGTKPFNRIVPAPFDGKIVTMVVANAYSFTKTPLMTVCVYFDEHGEYQGEYSDLGYCGFNFEELKFVDANWKFYGEW